MTHHSVSSRRRRCPSLYGTRALSQPHSAGMQLKQTVSRTGAQTHLERQPAPGHT